MYKKLLIVIFFLIKAGSFSHAESLIPSDEGIQVDLADITVPYSLEKQGQCSITKLYSSSGPKIIHAFEKPLTKDEWLSETQPMTDFPSRMQLQRLNQIAFGEVLTDNQLELFYLAMATGPTYSFPEDSCQARNSFWIIRSVELGSYVSVRIIISFENEADRRKFEQSEELYRSSLMMLPKLIRHQQLKFRAEFRQHGGVLSSTTDFYLEHYDMAYECQWGDFTACEQFFSKLFYYAFGSTGLRSQLLTIHQTHQLVLPSIFRYQFDLPKRIWNFETKFFVAYNQALEFAQNIRNKRIHIKKMGFDEVSSEELQDLKWKFYSSERRLERSLKFLE